MVDDSAELDPSHDVAWLNALPANEAVSELLKCCGSRRWAEQMVIGRPFPDLRVLNAQAKEIWWSLKPSDWLEAFRSHPRIGERKAAAAVSPEAQRWSGQEQAGLENSAHATIETLSRLNGEYEAKFGYIFIVCATGKSAEEMLTCLIERLKNGTAKELPIAAAEQAKITEIRLRKMLRF